MEYESSNAFGPNTGTVTNGTAGMVSYTIQPTDLQGLTPGVYWGTWILTDTNGNVLHVEAGQFEVKKSL